jgi:PTH2 family peptidyl-tRNA hydrolase
MNKSRIKQVIVIRKDLKMRRGKEIAQGSHASMKFLVDALKDKREYTEAENEWLFNGVFRKICVKVESEEELMNIHNKALEIGLTSKLITDAGATEFHGVPTVTCLAIGPDYSENIDPVTSELKLY